MKRVSTANPVPSQPAAPRESSARECCRSNERTRVRRDRGLTTLTKEGAEEGQGLGKFCDLVDLCKPAESVLAGTLP